MKPPTFTLLQPATVPEAVGALAHHEDAKVLAGGQSLVPLMAMRLARPSMLVDLNGTVGLTGIAPQADGALRIGAMTRQSELMRWSGLAAHNPLLAEMLPLVAHEAIRNRGTVGGSLAHGDPAAEWPAVALALDAVVDVAGPAGMRTIPAADLFLGPFMTALAPEEIITAVTVPRPRPGEGSAIVEFARRSGDFALAGVVALVQVVDATVRSCRLSFLSLSSTPWRPTALERALDGVPLDSIDGVIREALPSATTFTEDIHASADFRAQLARSLTTRAVRVAASRSRAGEDTR